MSFPVYNWSLLGEGHHGPKRRADLQPQGGIELLVDKTDTMVSQATALHRGARTVRCQMWWKSKRVLGLGVLIALVRGHIASPTLRVLPLTSSRNATNSGCQRGDSCRNH